MSDILKAVARIIAKECAEGRPVIEVPSELQRCGPCPNCGATVETGPVTFEARMGVPKSNDDVRGLIVCHGCLMALMFSPTGTFEIVPKRLLKKLPEVSRRFIRKHQEWYRQVKRGTQ